MRILGSLMGVGANPGGIYVVPAGLTGGVLSSVQLTIAAGIAAEDSVLRLVNRSGDTVLRISTAGQLSATGVQDYTFAPDLPHTQANQTNNNLQGMPLSIVDEGDRLEVVLSQPATSQVTRMLLVINT